MILIKKKKNFDNFETKLCCVFIVHCMNMLHCVPLLLSTGELTLVTVVLIILSVNSKGEVKNDVFLDNAINEI